MPPREHDAGGSQPYLPVLHLSVFHPLSLIPHPSSLIFHPSSFISHPYFLRSRCPDLPIARHSRHPRNMLVSIPIAPGTDIP